MPLQLVNNPMNMSASRADYLGRIQRVVDVVRLEDDIEKLIRKPKNKIKTQLTKHDDTRFTAHLTTVDAVPLLFPSTSRHLKLMNPQQLNALSDITRPLVSPSKSTHKHRRSRGSRRPSTPTQRVPWEEETIRATSPRQSPTPPRSKSSPPQAVTPTRIPLHPLPFRRESDISLDECDMVDESHEDDASGAKRPVMRRGPLSSRLILSEDDQLIRPPSPRTQFARALRLPNPVLNGSMIPVAIY